MSELGTLRAAYKFLKKDDVLPEAWWDRPYRAAKETHGKHLANRAMALSITVADLLLMGDPDVDAGIPGEVDFIDDVAPNARTRAEAAAVYLAMLSHFIADAWMPCHTDDRRLALYSSGLHSKMEDEWGEVVEDSFSKSRLLGSTESPDDILARAREQDARFGITFGPRVNHLYNDVWLDTVYCCRASFAICGMMVPPSQIDYGSDQTSSFDDTFAAGKPYSFEDITRVVLHDAVVSTAMVFRHIWDRVAA
jgi:hypothetical protein